MAHFPELSESDIIVTIVKNKLGDRTMKQLLYSVIPKYCDLPVSCRSIICHSLWLWQITDLFATEKSRYFAQPHPIIDNYYHYQCHYQHSYVIHGLRLK